MHVRKNAMWVGLAALFIAAICAPSRADGIKFMTNPKQAMALAAKQKKVVMVDLYTDWCTWCKELDKKVYSKSNVASAVRKDFIALKINPEKDPTGARWAKKFNIEGYPTILFLNSKEQLVHQVVGFAPAPAFLKEIQKAAAKGKMKRA